MKPRGGFVYLVADRRYPVLKIGRTKNITQRVYSLKNAPQARECLAHIGVDATPDLMRVVEWEPAVWGGASRHERIALAAAEDVAGFFCGEWFVADWHRVVNVVEQRVRETRIDDERRRATLGDEWVRGWEAPMPFPLFAPLRPRLVKAS